MSFNSRHPLRDSKDAFMQNYVPSFMKCDPHYKIKQPIVLGEWDQYLAEAFRCLDDSVLSSSVLYIIATFSV
jgi:hypothetical protein